MRNVRQLFKKRNSVLRLTFIYEGSAVRLVSRQSVEMTPPPSDPIGAQEGRSGFWYEVRDAQDRILYARIMENPVKFSAEVRSDDPARPLAWQTVSAPQGHFVLLMPNLAQARTLVLFSSPPEPEATGPAKELARFDLTQSPQGGEGAP